MKRPAVEGSAAQNRTLRTVGRMTDTEQNPAEQNPAEDEPTEPAPDDDQDNDELDPPGVVGDLLDGEPEPTGTEDQAGAAS